MMDVDVRVARAIKTVLRMTPAVGGAALSSVLFLLLSRHLLDAEVLRASNDEVGNYIQALGAIYAVLAAFVVYVVWGQFNDARIQCDREANELMDLSRIFEGLPAASSGPLQRQLASYVSSVLEVEWPAMAHNDDVALEAASELLDPLWAALHSLPVETECQRALHVEALTRFNDLADARTSRLSSARARIPLGLSMLLYFGAFSLVGSMGLIAIETFWIHAVTTASLAAAISHILYIVADLDDAFAGDWQVSRAPFEAAQRFINKRCSPPRLPQTSK